MKEDERDSKFDRLPPLNGEEIGVHNTNTLGLSQTKIYCIYLTVLRKWKTHLF